jgi:hypothetical protein
LHTGLIPIEVGNGGSGGAGGAGGEGEDKVNFTIPTVKFEDVGGIEHVIQDIRELIEYPLLHPELYSHIGVSPPRYKRKKKKRKKKKEKKKKSFLARHFIPLSVAVGVQGRSTIRERGAPFRGKRFRRARGLAGGREGERGSEEEGHNTVTSSQRRGWRWQGVVA